jgi:hypothetical protein
MKLEKASLQLLAYWTMNVSNVGPPVVKSHNQRRSVPLRVALRHPAAAAVCECENNCSRATGRRDKVLF